MSVQTAPPAAGPNHRQIRALARARQQAAAGNRPVLMHWLALPEHSQTTWVVFSRSKADHGYVVTALADAEGIRTLCECQAADAGAICWHRAMARLAALDEVPYLDGRAAAAGADGRDDEDDEGNDDAAG